MAHEAAVDRRPGGRDVELAAQLVEDRAWAPPGVGAAQLDDAGLDLRGHLVGTAIESGALVGECGKTFVGVADEPAVKGPAVDPVAGRGVGDGGAVEHLFDGVVALLNHRKLHQHDHVLLGSVEHK
jgi:hypothetical protein